MVTVLDVQAGLISYLKSEVNIYSLVTGSGTIEIREREWQGTQFTYPNIRLDVESVDPPSERCNYANINFIWQIYSEQLSSIEAHTIAKAIAVNHNESFTYTNSAGQEYTFSGIRVTTLDKALRISDRTWLVNVRLQGIASG